MSKKQRRQERREFFVFLERSYSGWSSGGSDKEFYFIEAETPRKALDKIWKRELSGRSKDYVMKVYNTSDDYHRGKKPLAERFKWYSDPNACNNPDCPYC